MLNIQEVQAINNYVQSFSAFEEMPIQELHKILFTLGGFLAFTGEQMSLAKKLQHQEEKKAYDSFIFSKMAQDIKITPTMANKYVDGCCAEFIGDYLLCERTNRAIVHVMDSLRTIISSLKQEMYQLKSQV